MRLVYTDSIADKDTKIKVKTDVVTFIIIIFSFYMKYLT